MQVPTELTDRVLCFWSLHSPNVRTVTVVPDGCVDLLVRSEVNGSRRVLLAGLDLTARPVETFPGTQFWGIRLHPGTDFEALGVTPREAVGRVVNLADCGDLSQRRWVAALQHTDNILDLLAEGAMTRVRPPSPATQEALRLSEPGTPLPFSTRTLHRHLEGAMGVSPRSWQGLARARRAARQIVRTSGNLTEIALRLGYSDQAHLSREIRRHFGVTPASLRHPGSPLIEPLNYPAGF